VVDELEVAVRQLFNPKYSDNNLCLLVRRMSLADSRALLEVIQLIVRILDRIKVVPEGKVNGARGFALEVFEQDRVVDWVVDLEYLLSLSSYYI